VCVFVCVSVRGFVCVKRSCHLLDEIAFSRLIIPVKLSALSAVEVQLELT
jgi:hypothetical protein